MHVAAFCTSFLLVCVAAHAVERDIPRGANCALTSPPESAGEEWKHGTVVRIYPRAKDINAQYTGCQVMWVQDPKVGWTTISVVAIVKGDPIRLWLPDKSQPELQACRYKNGRVISGNASTCAAPEFLIAKSVAPGCIDKLRKEVQIGGASSQLKECNHE